MSELFSSIVQMNWVRGSLCLPLVLFGYLLGSIPVAWLVTRVVTSGDLRKMGSGNVGVMNTCIQCGRLPGLFVFIAELGKGSVAYLLPDSLGAEPSVIYLTVLAAVVGTRWPIWLGFHGGRGNSVGIGALILISPLTLAACLSTWGIARLLLGNSFQASRACFFIWPVMFGVLVGTWDAFIFAVLLAFVYLSTHTPETDDHTAINEEYGSFASFMFRPR